MKPKLSKRSKRMSHDMDQVLPPGCKKDKERLKGDDSQNSDTMGSEELRLILIGKTGSGKSASRNTILGQRDFLSEANGSSVTKTCQRGTAELAEEAQRDGGAVTLSRLRRVVVVDTPGFGDTHLSTQEVHAEVAKCVSLSAPGPHAFLLVVPIGRYTEDQDKAVCEFTKIFRDESVWLHTLVLFTRGDDLEGTTIEDFLQKAPPKLQVLINRCGGRYHVFNNKDPSNSVQVRELINKVEKRAQQTNKGFYSNVIFSEAEAAIREEWESILRKRGQARGKEQGGNSSSSSREGQAQPNGQQNSGSSNSSSRGSSRQQSSSWFSSWLEAALSPTVLNRIKTVVAAVAGIAIGALCGAVAPLAAAAGASLMGKTVGFAARLFAGNAVAAATGPAVGAVVTAASGKVAVGAVVGAAVGGIVGAIAGAEADSPQEGARDAAKQVGVLGVSAVAIAGVGGGLAGGKAALSAALGMAAGAANTAALGGAEGAGMAKTVVGGVGGAAALGMLGRGLTVKIEKEKTRSGTGTEGSYSERTSFEFQLNK